MKHKLLATSLLGATAIAGGAGLLQNNNSQPQAPVVVRITKTVMAAAPKPTEAFQYSYDTNPQSDCNYNLKITQRLQTPGWRWRCVNYIPKTMGVKPAGLTDPNSKTIYIESTLEFQQYTSIILHESAHAWLNDRPKKQQQLFTLLKPHHLKTNNEIYNTGQAYEVTPTEIFAEAFTKCVNGDETVNKGEIHWEYLGCTKLANILGQDGVYWLA